LGVALYASLCYYSGIIRYGGEKMVKVKRISIEQAKSMKRTIKPSAIVQEYTQILKELAPGEAREIEAKSEKEKPQTIKNRIVRLGKSLQMPELKVKRVGDIITFWLEPEAKEPRTKGKK
jgi:hypothetical protein